MTDWHLAQINVAHARYPLEDPRIADFVAQLDAINALAERSPGFVWRLQGDSGNATDIKVENDPNVIVNMSLWRNAEALFDFVYKSAHRPVMTRRREWFLPPEGAYQALWWVEAGRTPTLQEGLDRLAHLDRNGPSAQAFTFKTRFPAPGHAGGPRDLAPEPYCVGWE